MDQNNVLKTFQHTNFLDTLLFVDNEQKHVVTALRQINPQKSSHRDMCVFFTRRMADPLGEHSAAGFDSEKPHSILPFATTLKSKHLVSHYPNKKFGIRKCTQTYFSYVDRKYESEIGD